MGNPGRNSIVMLQYCQFKKRDSMFRTLFILYKYSKGYVNKKERLSFGLDNNILGALDFFDLLKPDVNAFFKTI